MVQAEARVQHLWRPPDALVEALLRPRDESLGRSLLEDLPASPACSRGLRLQTPVLDHPFRRLRDDTALRVEASPSGAPRNLLELSDRQQRYLLSVELAKACKEYGADRNVDSDAEGVRTRDHPQQPLLGEALDEPAVAGQQSGMVEPDAVGEEPAQSGSVGGVEAEVCDGLADRPARVAVAHPGARKGLGLLGGLALREVHDVDWSEVTRQEILDGLVQGRLGVLEVEGHRALEAMDVAHGASGPLADPFLDRSGVAERRGEQQELAVSQHDQGNLPGDAAALVVVVVELVHCYVGSVEVFALGDGHVREHLGGATDDRRLPVDAGVACQHADVLGSEGLAQIEELLAHQRLDGCRVEGASALAQGLEVEPDGDQRLAGARGCREHDVAAGHPLE